jgi:hypothetical protein
MLSEFLIEAAIAAALAELIGIMVVGSKGNWVVAAPAAEGESMLAIPLFAAATWALLIACAAFVCAPSTFVEGVVDEEFAAAVSSVWLIPMSCSNWLSEII